MFKINLFTSRKAKYLLFLVVILVILVYTIPNKTDTEIKPGIKILAKTQSVKTVSEKITEGTDAVSEHKNDMKHILLWTSAKSVPFTYMGEGQKGFIDRKCPYINCFVTGNQNYLDDITKFDVVAFNGPEVIHMSNNILPLKRSPHQKYAFASIESSDYYPVCSERFDGYFNWTWTFRLDSDVRWGYMVIRDENNDVVGPNKVMHWIESKDMKPVTDEFKETLKTKTKAAAWFVSNCYSRSKREDFVKELQKELEKYNLTVDIYGKCGLLKCSRDIENECFDLIKEKYYFYLSFENSNSEDYATEKLLNAVQNNAVPIVYGAANYSRFLPDGVYLDAKKIKTKDLAEKMSQLIKNPDDYADYFRWKNHYSYHKKMESVDTDEYCLFCSILNDEQKVKERTVYQSFRKWWDPPNRC